ncbi:MAG: hypothetical protein GF401_03410 [Chitinivibrionales bacterium]|nr:hypothetical protein [Chitinivibrionales bacterium]
MKTKIVSVAVGILLSGTLCFGQSLLGLKYPFGVPLRSQSGMALAMGGASVAVPDDQHVLLSNPANLGSINRTVFSSLVSFDFLNLKSEDGSTNHLTLLPKQISFGVSMEKFGGIGFSMERRSNAETKYQIDSLVQNPATVSRLERSLSQNGGLTSYGIGYGISFGKWVSAGLRYDRVYLSIDNSKLSTVYGESFGAQSGISYEEDARDSVRFLWGGNGVRLGVTSRVVKGVTVGVAGEYYFESKASKKLVLYSGNYTINTAKLEHDFQLPPTITGGASWNITPQWIVAGDVSTTFWDYFHSGGLIEKPDVEYATGFSAGAQFIPAPELLAPKYWETIQWRGGFNYTQLPAKDSRQYTFSLGSGLPLKANGMIDIILEYGRRTDDRYEDYYEELFGISIGINGGRKWAKSSRGNY